MKKYIVTLSAEEQKALRDLISRRNVKSAVLKRAYVLLGADSRGEGLADEQLAHRYQVTARTVEGVRRRLVREGFSAALYGKPRTVFKAKVFDARVEAHLLALRCSTPPQGCPAWTLHLLAERLVSLGHVRSISHESVRQLLKKNELKPWTVRQWVIPEASAAFVCAMEEVLDLYEQPYNEHYPVVCLDESPRQLVSEVRRGFVDHHGVARVDCEYHREGVAEIYLICEPKAGRRFIEVRDHHRSPQWAQVVAHIAETLYPHARHITLVQDNLSAHRKAALYEVFEPQRAREILRRITIVPTPKHGSWLNMAEIELSVLSRVALKGRIGSKEQPIERITAYQQYKNNQPAPINWQFTTDRARTKLNRLYPKPKNLPWRLKVHYKHLEALPEAAFQGSIKQDLFVIRLCLRSPIKFICEKTFGYSLSS